ncbi:Cadherin [Trinorchestia longiramus]|nr:Cadherin [Trinorchestia longiramus]
MEEVHFEMKLTNAALSGLLLLLLLVAGSTANLPPQFTASMDLHVVSEDVPVGTSIYTLTAADPEGGPVKFGLSGTPYVAVNPLSGVVTVTQQLDRETADSLRMTVSVEDEVPGGTNNVVTLPVTLIVIDANDNAPVFGRERYEASVGEDSLLGSTVLSGIAVTDKDQVGDALQLQCLPKSGGDDDVCSVMHLEATTRSASLFTGNMILMAPLSFARRSSYEFLLQASDGYLTSTAEVVVLVQDVQNRPPEFRGSRTGVVEEDAPIGTLVMSVQATDGDVGQPRRVVYSLLENPHDFFLVDSSSGELRTARPLDREALSTGDGVVRIIVQATEVNDDGSLAKENESYSTTMITVTIRDVNDEAPTFNKREYRTSVPEDVADGTPLAQLDMLVRDTDVGSNAVFGLKLLDSSGKFSVEPEVASGSSSVSLRVAKGPLDFENPNEQKFILLVVATETLTKEKLSSTATVVVSVSDVNDNAPQFDQDAYTARISETAVPGSVVGTITARDRDQGALGTSGIVYSLSGNGADRFGVDAESGVITVADCPTPGSEDCLDYETRDTYFLSMQATDNHGSPGQSQSSVVPVKVSLTDDNDNPPAFVRLIYTSAIEEKAPDFDPPLIVKAEDPDVGSRITYSLVGGEAASLFQLNARTGRISLADPVAGLDISDLPSDTVTVLVKASDGKASSTAEVRISVRDANNHSPEFSQELYLAAVQETAVIGSAVMQVQATDGDVGENAAISYRIQRGAFQDFSMNATTGVLTVARPLDYDTRDTYNIGTSNDSTNLIIYILYHTTSKKSHMIFRPSSFTSYSHYKEVLGADGGRPQHVSTATVTLSVVNNNDKSPRLTPHTQRAQVREDAAPGVVVHVVKAKDPDVASEEGLRFRLTGVLAAVDSDGRPLETEMASAVQSMFGINEATGEVFVSGPVERDLVTEVTLGVMVSDVSADPPQNGQGALVITLLDVNDFPPMFPPPWSPESPVIRLQVAEELPLGTVVTSMEATDADSNIGGYRLTVMSPPPALAPNEDDANFTLLEEHEPVLVIDPGTGIVTVNGRLDYEQETVVECLVEVVDTGLPQLTTTATLVVELENLNDEAPEFAAAAYEASVEEHAAPGTTVVRVLAVDHDKGELGRVLYELTGLDASLFSVSEEGEVVVSPGALLDRENKDSVSLRVVARDTAPPGQTPRQTSVPLVVRIEDINDHSPVFSQRQYTATVVENLPLHPPAPILQLTAHDADAGENAVIAYTITDGDEQGNFRLDSQSGILYPAKPLTRLPQGDSLAPTASYSLTVVATDRNGTGRASGEAHVLVSLLPQNQHKPVYVSPARPDLTIHVPENIEAPVEVAVLTATDEDVGDNGLVRYHLRVGDANVQHTDKFTIDPNTGSLQTRVALDREDVAKYELVLVAKDQGSPISYETLRVLTVLVDDVDDHRPEFREGDLTPGHLPTFVLRVPENREPDTKIGRITAVDLDADTNAQVYYHVVESDSEDPKQFYIDKLHGMVYASVSLDREKRSNYSLLVAATNSPTLDPAVGQAVVAASRDHALPKYANGSLASVIIQVDDENDSPPKFAKSEFFAGISSGAEVDKLVRVVAADDPDAGSNGTLVYVITAANLYKPGESKSIGSLVPPPFRLEGASGRLVTAALMTQYKHHRFRLELQATEVASPHRVTKASVHVWVWEDEQLVRVVLSQPPQQVVLQQEAIADTLSQVAEGTAVVDQVRYHVMADNTVNTNWTDMLVHVVNSSGHVLAIDDVLKQMDKGYMQLTAPHHNFTINNVYPALLPSPSGGVDVRLAGLIALLLVLFIGFISFSVVCCCLRYWVMGPAAKSQENLLKRGFEDDIGINKTENPLWLDQKLKRYEEQELSMQVMSEFDTTAPPGAILSMPSPDDLPHSVTLDAEWNPDRSSHLDLAQIDGQSNTYATIQKSHGGTIRSMKLRTLVPEEDVSLGGRPLDQYDYYATLEHRRGDMAERTPMHQVQGPKVPGVQTPHTNFSNVLEGLEFTGSTFQPPDSGEGTSLSFANRPLPQEPLEGTTSSATRTPLRTDERGQPVLVAELI